MALALTDTQFDNTTGPSTRPIYLIQLQVDSGWWYFSSGGTILFDGQQYISGITVSRIAGTDTATVDLPLYPMYIDMCLSGAWRGQKTLNIYAVPAVTSSDAYSLDDGLLVLDGYIETCALTGQAITLGGRSKTSGPIYTPRLCTNEVSNLVPDAGTVFQLPGTTYYVLESRR
jgi:hypothetical protein